ncbi:MAG: DUF4743 domain-containing protein [Burkholderiaceae bacterium]|jgi:8-oxo-dGTP pyrophosphatase MutT (NUDIX family)
MGFVDLIRAANPLGLWPGDEASAAAFDRIPLFCDRLQIGSIDPAFSGVLLEFSDLVRPVGTALEVVCPGPVRRRSGAFAEASRRLLEAGYLRGWRDEQLAIAAYEGGPKLFEIERAAARFFGFLTHAAHLNGLAPKGMWISRRSPDKSIDPGLLDNLVGGGVAAGMSVSETLVKEAWEEAGIGAEQVAHAQFTATIGICRLTDEGLQRELLHAHDLVLAAGFEPRNQDGEVVEIRLETLHRVSDMALAGLFTVDATMVLFDYLCRSGDRAVTSHDQSRFRALCRRPN